MRLSGLAAAALALGSAAAAEESHLLVVGGLGGEAKYVEAFHEWAAVMVDAAEKSGLPAANVVYLAEKPETDAARIDGPSTKVEVEKAFGALVTRLRSGDALLVLLIGHGSFQNGESRFNLPGPDLTAGELAALLDRLPPASVAVVNAASASGEFAKALGKPGRIVVTATKSGMERNETVFGRYFVEAYAGDVADADKDGRVSLLEAFEYARRNVARYYETEKRLLTEHAALDDSGDGAASATPDPVRGDGARARSFFLGRPGGAAAAAAPISGDDPPTRALRAQRQALAERIEALKVLKASMEAGQYQKELEALLLQLALKDQEIREGPKAVPR